VQFKNICTWNWSAPYAVVLSLIRLHCLFFIAYLLSPFSPNLNKAVWYIAAWWRTTYCSIALFWIMEHLTLNSMKLALCNMRQGTAVPLPQCRRQTRDGILRLLILGLGTRWGEWSASRPGRPLPPGPIGQEAGWASEARGNILSLCQGSNLSRPICRQTLHRLSYRRRSERFKSIYYTPSLINSHIWK
jgi:hypothetical protein